MKTVAGRELVAGKMAFRHDFLCGWNKSFLPDWNAGLCRAGASE
jgi:hypothetical protein